MYLSTCTVLVQQGDSFDLHKFSTGQWYLLTSKAQLVQAYLLTCTFLVQAGSIFRPVHFWNRPEKIFRPVQFWYRPEVSLDLHSFGTSHLLTRTQAVWIGPALSVQISTILYVQCA